MATQYAYRTQKQLGLTEGSPSYSKVGAFQPPEGPAKQFAYSPDGRFFAFAGATAVQIVDASNGAVLHTLDAQVVELSFSTKGSFLSTWERPVKLENDQQHKNLRVWSTQTAQEVASFTQKAQSGWPLQFTADEVYACRMVNSELHAFKTSDWAAGIAFKLKVEGSSQFSLSPGRNPSAGFFVPEKKGAPGSVKVFNLLTLSSSPANPRPTSQKTFFKADKVQWKWNAAGTMLLVVTQTDVDKTNKNYYGETNMYLMSAAGGFDCRVSLDKEGPIHDFAWSPNEKEFSVCYGSMPSKTVIFDHRVNIVHDFGVSMRNSVLYNPQGRLMLIAGFGNLSGKVDIWDRKTLKKVTDELDASNTSFCEWSPDGRFLLCATLSPRLRVDNGVRIFHWSGGLMHWDQLEELYQASWRPAPAGQFEFKQTLSPAPTPSSSVASTPVKTASKPAGAYRPPHARGTALPDHFKREDQGGQRWQASGANGGASPGGGRSLAALQMQQAQGGGRQRSIPGAAPPGGAPQQQQNGQGQSSRRKKNNNNNNNKQDGEGSSKPAQNGNAAPAAPQPAAPAASSFAADVNSNSLSSEDKKRRALIKKLGAIDQLKAKVNAGEKLEKTQEQKIESEAEVKKELAALG